MILYFIPTVLIHGISSGIAYPVSIIRSEVPSIPYNSLVFLIRYMRDKNDFLYRRQVTEKHIKWYEHIMSQNSMHNYAIIFNYSLTHFLHLDRTTILCLCWSSLVTFFADP